MSEWLLTYEGFEPDDEGHREAMCALGNGYFVTRGAAPEAVADGVHYPGTYVAGVYNRLGSEVAGRWVENESIVNVPNWLPLTFRVEGGPWFGGPDTEVLEHRVELDLLRGVLTRQSRLRDPDGHTLHVTQRRFVSMRDPHLAGLETTLVAEGWSGRLEVRSALDGTVTNAGVPRYATLPNRHLRPLGTGRENDEVVYLQTETTQSHVRIAEAARTRLYRGGEHLALVPELVESEGYVALQVGVDVADGDDLMVEKVVSLFTSRDDAVSEPGEEACRRISRWAPDFEDLLERHVVSWRHAWSRARITVGGGPDFVQAIHIDTFHVGQTVSNNTVGRDVGVPARGLHGEAYRGHVFWDELFILPFLSLRMPQVARTLLEYRYRRLDEARAAAYEAGANGAMFPWQSASSGREETQTMHLNPVSQRWLPDASHLQRHVNAAIAYSTWQYYQATSDLDFLRFYGAEMILEVARFWASTATYSHSLDRYEITGVMGPDEYHDGYPDRDAPGLDNNAYTNLMAVWCLCRAFDTLDLLPNESAQDLTERLAISPAELDHWRDVSHKMRVCFHDGVISQFEGYEHLAELDWDDYRTRYPDIARLDRILESEGLSANAYQVAKQPDVLMLHYLLSSRGLAALLTRLGYDADNGLIERCIDYYGRRTVNGSSLSRVVEAWLAARRDPERSWALVERAARADLDDGTTGTTREGVHLGAMAGTLDILQRAYTGLETEGDALYLDPCVPVALGTIEFTIRYRGHLVDLEFTPSVARVRVDANEGVPITVVVQGARHDLVPGELLEVDLTTVEDGSRGVLEA